MTSLLRIIITSIILTLLLTLANCCFEADGDCCNDDCDPQVEFGLRPVYASDSDETVKIGPPESLVNPGKIYVYGNLLLVSERFKGVHVFDNSDPENPEKIYFLTILGNVDVAVKDGFLYADQLNSILTFDMRALGNGNIVMSRVEEVLSSDRITIEPPQSNVFYECPDSNLGPVVFWVQDSVVNPCYKN